MLFIKLGGKIVIQLSHGGRQCASIFLGGSQPVAPSSIMNCL